MEGIEVKWDRTLDGVKRVERAGEIEERDGISYYHGRRVICRDSPIDGGVYLGGHGREAITVNSNSFRMRQLYEATCDRARKSSTDTDGKVSRNDVLRAVYDTVREEMPYNEWAVGNIARIYASKSDEEISLDVFIKAKAGVCRQQALACAALVERFKNDRILRGKLSVDRNSIFRSAHAWCRYTTFSGNVWILDPAQNYFGRLKDCSESQKLRYSRNEDKVGDNELGEKKK